MGARRPKPTALKERTSVRPNLGLSRLFAAANALVPRAMRDEGRSDEHASEKPSIARAPQTFGAEDRTLKIDDPRLKEISRQRTVSTRATPLALEVTRASEVKPLPYVPRSDEPSEYGTAVVVENRKKPKMVSEGTHTQPIPVRTSVTKLRKADDGRVRSKLEVPREYVVAMIVVPLIGLASFGYLSGAFDSVVAHGSHAPKSALTPDQIKERLEFHREITGSHLNRDRIDVQIQNFRTAPDLAPDDHRVKPPNMMDGLPLTGETNSYTRGPKADLPSDPTYSEAKTAYGLQEEQDRAEFERRAQKEWVKEFVENARKDGYDVRIDQFGNVTSKEIPLEERGPLPENSQVFSDGQ